MKPATERALPVATTGATTMATFTETLAKIHAHASKEFAAKKVIRRNEQARRKPAAKQHKPGDALKGILLLIFAPVIFVILFGLMI